MTNSNNRLNGSDRISECLAHKKCEHFSESDKMLVKEAISLAESIHAGQVRKGGSPYIEHIYSSISIYLNDTLEGDERCDLRDLLVLILHDCIEDVPEQDAEKIIEIYKQFGVNVWVDILRLSEPTPKVIRIVRSLREKRPYLFSVAGELGFLQMYDLVDENDPEKWIAGLTPDSSLSREMLIQIKEYWYLNMAPLYHGAYDLAKQKKIFADLIALGNIASLSPRLFRIKGTERRHNLQDYTGLLNKEGVMSARRTMDTTFTIYVPKALEIGDHALARGLISDRNNERAAFVRRKLIKESE